MAKKWKFRPHLQRTEIFRRSKVGVLNKIMYIKVIKNAIYKIIRMKNLAKNLGKRQKFCIQKYKRRPKNFPWVFRR